MGQYDRPGIRILHARKTAYCVKRSHHEPVSANFDRSGQIVSDARLQVLDLQLLFLICNFVEPGMSACLAR